MEKYKPDEQYFGYHLEYYFLLLEKRRDVEGDIIHLKESSKKLDDKLKDFPLELPKAENTAVEEIISRVDSQLKSISDIITSRWKNIMACKDPSFDSLLKFKRSIAPNDRKYPIQYFLKPNKRELLLERAPRLADELGLKQRNIGYLSGSQNCKDFIECYFVSIGQATEITKKYLINHSDDQ